MSGVAPSRAAAGSSVTGTPAIPTRSSFLPWAEDPAGPPRQVSTITHADSTAETRIDIVIRGTCCARQPFRGRDERVRGPVRNLLPRKVGATRWPKWTAGARGRNRANPGRRTPPKDLTTLTFFFVAAYTRAAMEALGHERLMRGQER